MWAELGLEDAPEAPRRHDHPPPLGHESMARFVPNIEAVAREVADRIRRASRASIERVIGPEDLGADLTVRRFLEEHAERAHAAGLEGAEAVADANLLGAHLEYLCNFELHRRKVFWVEEGLAWMLAQTKLDIVGEALQLPFPSFALVFTDRDTLALAERVLSREEHCSHRGRILQVLTAYVSELDIAGCRGIRVAFSFDDLSRDWPYLLCRDLPVQPDAHLDGILGGSLPDVDRKSRDPVFDSVMFKRLVQRALNATLYATSAGPTVDVRQVRGASAQSVAPAEVAMHTSESVYHLPGHIDIREVRALQRVARGPSGRTLMHRFLVRGHWRRANRSWKEQHARWIKPYWKGPEMATIIERSYRLRTPAAGPDRGGDTC